MARRVFFRVRFERRPGASPSGKVSGAAPLGLERGVLLVPVPGDAAGNP